MVCLLVSSFCWFRFTLAGLRDSAKKGIVTSSPPWIPSNGILVPGWPPTRYVVPELYSVPVAAVWNKRKKQRTSTAEVVLARYRMRQRAKLKTGCPPSVGSHSSCDEGEFSSAESASNAEYA